MTTPKTTTLAAALAKAQGEFPPITRDKRVTVRLKSGGSYEFAYAPLDQILGLVRKPLADNGLALSQLLNADGLVTLLLHESGEQLEARTPIPESADIQAYGSAITYLRRYAIQAMLGIAAEEDDDGNRDAGNQVAPQHSSKEAEDLLGRIEKSGIAMAGGSSSYKGEWRETPDGHVIGFRLQLPDKDIPQVLVTGAIGEALYLAAPAILGESVRVKGHLYNVKQPGRRGYYRLIVGNYPEDFIETADLRIPATTEANPQGVMPQRDESEVADVDGDGGPYG